MGKVNVPLVSARRVVIATGNPGKLREMLAILGGHGLEPVAQSAFGISPPVEDGDSFVANALIKARHAAACSGLPAIADDSGLEVDALGGRPGIHSARYAGPGADNEANNDKLLAELAGVPRRASQCALPLRDGVRASCVGRRADRRRGRLGGAHRNRPPRRGRLRLRPALHRRGRRRHCRARCPRRRRTA